MSTGSAQRERQWLSLLCRLTQEVDAWAVWKSADPAFEGSDDVDAIAPERAWPRVREVFRDWAHAAGFLVVECRHVPWTLNLFAFSEQERTFLQLEVTSRTTFRGSVLFTAEDLLPLTQLDPRGFRALRRGAEGVLKLTLHGLRYGGRPNHNVLTEHGVPGKLRDDPEGVRGAAALYGPARRAVVRAARAVSEGGWDRRAMLAIELAAALRAPARPHLGVRRWWFRRVVRPRCPVLRTVYADHRHVLGEIGAWVAVAARDHTVAWPEAPRAPAPTAGRLVVLVGPDGVGKTTVARALLELHNGAAGYVYFRPPLRGSLPARPPEGPRPRGNKHPRPQPLMVGWLRLVKNLVWFWIGYLRVVRPIVRSGGLVVGDRWAYGYAVQPGPLGFFGPDWLARLGVRLMPHPTLVVNLTAPPEVIAARKDELTLPEIVHELEEWRRLPVPRLESIDASGQPEAIRGSIVERLRALPARARMRP